MKNWIYGKCISNALDGDLNNTFPLFRCGSGGIWAHIFLNCTVWSLLINWCITLDIEPEMAVFHVLLSILPVLFSVLTEIRSCEQWNRNTHHLSHTVCRMDLLISNRSFALPRLLVFVNSKVSFIADDYIIFRTAARRSEYHSGSTSQRKFLQMLCAVRNRHLYYRKCEPKLVDKHRDWRWKLRNNLFKAGTDTPGTGGAASASAKSCTANGKCGCADFGHISAGL